MRALLPLFTLALVAQTPEPNLQADYLRQLSGSYQHMVAIVVTHADGSPYRGTVQCEGWWHKYADEDAVLSAWGFPFTTDSRGGIVMNPRRTDEPFSCWASAFPDQRVLVDFERPDNVYELELK